MMVNMIPVFTRIGHQARGILIWEQKGLRERENGKAGNSDVGAKGSQRTREEKSWEF